MKKLMLVPLFVAATAASSVAFAGAKWGYPVVVNANSFVGSMGATRSSGWSNDYIQIVDSGTSITISAVGGANNAAASCVTADPVIMAQLRSANSDATFYVGFTAGKCTAINVINSSAQAPKVM